MKKWIALIGFVLSLTLLTGCVLLPTPPSTDLVDQRFNENIANIEIIISFMEHSGYEDIYINDTSGTMLADLETVEIPDEAVKNAVEHLLGKGLYRSIDKIENTVFLLQWAGSMDLGCGIAYSINNTDPPEVQYMTQLLPLSQAGWYYYVSDFNAWRVQQQNKVSAEQGSTTLPSIPKTLPN